jgi:hypothetical protein
MLTYYLAVTKQLSIFRSSKRLYPERLAFWRLTITLIWDAAAIVSRDAMLGCQAGPRL